MAICQAGHPSSFLLKKSGEIIIDSLGGVPVGFLEDAGYEAQEYDLDAGDRIYIYTGGIIECDNPFEEQLGEAKFLEILLKHKSKSFEEVNSLLQDYLKEWRAKPDYGDDISLIAIEIK
jgi:sigma-B regulation protein RsbU (phosphoserine phosphatase)